MSLNKEMDESTITLLFIDEKDGEMKTRKNVHLLICVFAMVLASGCVIEPESDDEETEEVDADETVVQWTEGLTTQEIIESMPVWVEAGGADVDETAVDNGVAVTRRAMGCSTIPRISFCLPESVVTFLDFENATLNFWWRAWNGDWVQIFPVVQRELVEDSFVFSFEDEPMMPQQTVRYYKIDYVDDHNGETYSTIVTFAVSPNSNPIQVTLSDETEAAATSDLLLNYNLLWPDINQQEKPQTQTIEGMIPPCTPINLQINTDFSALGFNSYEFPHTSNSTFCKVSVETPPADSNVAQRLKYQFEDLPISRLNVEPNHQFDYNDVVVYLDLMNALQ